VRLSLICFNNRQGRPPLADIFYFERAVKAKIVCKLAALALFFTPLLIKASDSGL
jgi:hypothetical protein